jgi:hypothetical protein
MCSLHSAFAEGMHVGVTWEQAGAWRHAIQQSSAVMLHPTLALAPDSLGCALRRRWGLLVG